MAKIGWKDCVKKFVCVGGVFLRKVLMDIRLYHRVVLRVFYMCKYVKFRLV